MSKVYRARKAESCQIMNTAASRRNTGSGYGPERRLRISQDPIGEKLRSMDDEKAERRRAKKDGFSRRDVDWKEVIDVTSNVNPNRVRVGKANSLDELNTGESRRYKNEFSIPIDALGNNPNNKTITAKEKKLLNMYREVTGREPPLRGGDYGEEVDHYQRRQDYSREGPQSRAGQRYDQDPRRNGRDYPASRGPPMDQFSGGNAGYDMPSRDQFSGNHSAYGRQAPPNPRPVVPGQVIPKKPEMLPFSWKRVD